MPQNTSDYNKEYYRKNHAKIRKRMNAYQKVWREKNREKVNAQERMRYNTNEQMRERKKASMRIYARKRYLRNMPQVQSNPFPLG